MKSIKRLAAVAVFTAVLGMAGPSSAATTGTQHFHLLFAGPFSATLAGGEDGRTVITTGTVNSVGYEENVSQGPGPAPGTFVGRSDFVFPVGTYTIDVTGTVESTRTSGSTGCFVSVTVSGTYQIVGGSGAFAGALGTGTFTGRNDIRGTEVDGACSMKGARLVSRIHGSGSLVLP